MSHVIIFQNDNGGVSVCIPTGELPIDKVLEKDVPKDRGARIVHQDDLPKQHNDFFDAWEMDGSTITVNLSKAKELTKNRLRAERAPLLAAQDVLFQRALESGADTTAIVAEKNRLRDITGLADAATSLEELRLIKAGA
jgi:hypothetical protein